MNDFFEKQNEPRMLKLLAGQRQIYCDVKAILMKSFLMGVVVPSILSLTFFVMSFFPGYTVPWIKTFLTIYGLVFFIINHFIMEHVSNCKKKAARIQEEYDTSLFNMEWNDIVAGKKTSVSESIEYAQKHLANEGDRRLRNWYLNAPINVSAPLMVMLCQSKNMGWDAGLKKKTSTFLSIILALNIIMFAITFIFTNPTYQQFIAFVAILLPTYQFYYRYVSENKKSVARADELRILVENTLRQVGKEQSYDKKALEKQSRVVQDQIFNYRATGNPVPDFMHKRHRAKDEERYDRIFEEYSSLLEGIAAPS
ncbi:S-4TM family putative pore-forming effector [Leclercia adecarboxylata]|uniref:S-4TM family putative pore-forming effector n=1 Tax=Leclercia adecarboxylata TaxID=83655 RepID=UPI002029C0FA|nr:S-4TM family putative pore-forming effector [Leclercia adecarboxylata]URO00340.1 S-4TM family putative pore-forming effector [Leclercia adecarboxylata]